MKKISIKKVIIISIIFMITSVVFVKTMQSVFENKKVDQVVSITLNTAESGLL